MIPDPTASKVFSIPRITTLVSSIIVALASGTNYVFSAYAPQLAARLRISHTKLNVIGLAGNISIGPIWGRIVDRRGPRILLACAFVFLLVGYSGIRYFYDSPDTVEGEAEKLSHFEFVVLTICAFLTHAGGSGGLTAAVNATAKSFPDEMRASVTGLVISGFGLSAFFFSSLARVLFPDDTSSFLLTLALGTSFPMILGFFLVRPIPLPSPSSTLELQDDIRPLAASTRLSTSSIPVDGIAHSAGVDTLLGDDSIVFEHQHPDDSPRTLVATHQHRGHYYLHHLRASTEMELLRHHSEHYQDAPGTRRETESDSRGHSHSTESASSISFPSHGKRRFSSAVSHSRTKGRVIEVIQDLHGKSLFASGDFWLMASILTLLAGPGLMYINNVGSIAQALFLSGHLSSLSSLSSSSSPSPSESLRYQTLQVSLISIFNCTGRLLSGVSADILKNTFCLPRSYALIVISSLFLFSQLLLAVYISDVEDLWQTSVVLGLAYGGLFGVMPTITIEWFGLSHFSENWGFVGLTPLVGGNLFGLAFGRDLDAHAPHLMESESGSSSLPSSSSSPSPSPIASINRILARASPGTGIPREQCYEGRQCYVSSVYFTTVACTCALGLSAYAAWRDRRRMTVRPADYEEIIWEEEEDEEEVAEIGRA